MVKLKYYGHLVSNSKYNLLMTLCVILIIYGCFYSGDIIYCMNNGDIPSIAEPKRPTPVLRVSEHKPLTHVEQAVINQVHEYIGTQQIIENQEKKIEELTINLERAENGAMILFYDYGAASQRYLALEMKTHLFVEKHSLQNDWKEFSPSLNPIRKRG